MQQESNGQPELDCTGCDGCSGCGITEWSRASYGPTFDAQNGGVFAMKWDQDGIAVCECIPLGLLLSRSMHFDRKN